MANGKTDDLTPPYLPWATFTAFLGSLKATPPTRIDNSVMKGKSGTDQSQIKTALRFLGLIGPGDVVTPALRELLQAQGTASWPGNLQNLLKPRYQGVVGSVDLSAGTLGELREAFSQNADVTGSVRDKAVRFWLSAMKEADVPLSPHFAAGAATGDKPKRSSGPRGRKPRAAEEDDVDTLIEKPPEGTSEVRLPIPGKPDLRMWLPADLTEVEWAMLDTYVRMFIKIRPAPEA